MGQLYNCLNPGIRILFMRSRNSNDFESLVPEKMAEGPYNLPYPHSDRMEMEFKLGQSRAIRESRVKDHKEQ